MRLSFGVILFFFICSLIQIYGAEKNSIDCLEIVFLPTCLYNGETAQLKIAPDSTKVFKDQTFEINVVVSNVENLFAVAFDVVYDPDKISFESISEGSFLNEDNQAQTFFLWDEQEDRLVIAISRQNGNAEGVSSIDDASFVSLSFRAKNYGWTDVFLENAGLMDPDLDLISFEQTDGVVQIPGPPQIINLPDTTLLVGDTISLWLNDYVYDPDTPVEELSWEVLQTPHIGYVLNDSDNVLTFWLEDNVSQTFISLRVSDAEGFTDEAMIAVENPLDVFCPDHSDFHLMAYPNPFHDKLYIEARLGGIVDHPPVIRIFSIDGNLLATLAYGVLQADGSYFFEFDSGRNLGYKILPGIYLLDLGHDYNVRTLRILKI